MLSRLLLAGAACFTLSGVRPDTALAEPVGAGSATVVERVDSIAHVQAALAARGLAVQAVERELFERVNLDRKLRGLAPLAFDADLLEVARVRAGAQIPLPRLSHTDTSGELAIGKLLAAGGVTYTLAGENLARLPVAEGEAAAAPAIAERAEVALMNSPTHRKNILETRFTSVAIGAVTDPSGRVIFAQIFRSS